MANAFRAYAASSHCCPGAMKCLSEAMGLLPAPEQRAFSLACQLCPDLVQAESDPLLFLLHEAMNAWDAAVRLAKYWELRMATFGPDRAFRSVLDLSGNGALPPDAVEYIATGVAVALPPDDQGRSVLFVDRARLPPEALHLAPEVRERAAFYGLAKLMLLRRSFVVVFFTTTKPRFFPASGRWFSDALENAFPVKMHAVHVLCRSPPSAYRRFVETMVPVLLRLLKNNYSRYNVTVDIGETEDLRKNLIQLGLHPERFPETAGGTWTYDGFDDWIRQQVNSSTIPNRSLEASTRSSPISANGLSSPKGLELLAAAVDQDHGSEAFETVKQIDAETRCYVKNPSILAAATPTSTFGGCSSGGRAARCEHSSTTNAGSPDSQLVTAAGAESEALRLAMQSIPPQEKTSFTDAIRYAPDHVRAEADTSAFLSLENGNAHAAAVRLASYWNIRTAFFGDRAFLPMRQSGCTFLF